MKKQLVLLFLIQGIFAFGQEWPKDLDTGRGVDYLTADEKEIIFLINKVRSNPSLFAKTYLESRKDENSYAKECYEQLLTWAPQEILKPSKALSFAARDHATDMGEKGAVGHLGTKGDEVMDRVDRYGTHTGSFKTPSETCAYGHSDPLDIVLYLLIDNQVKSRGHRKNIMQKHVRFIGCSIKPHLAYISNCVIVMTDSIEDKK
jgi:Cysteine-rich secretory protein family